jgi:hypothetical protein
LWKGAGTGDEMTLTFESGVEGKRILSIVMTQAPDYAKVRISVNGVVVLRELDLYGRTVKRRPEERVSVELKKGSNEIRIQITGSNPEANPVSHLVGIDYLRIVE